MQDTFISDLRYTVRQARKTPGSILASFLILMAGIAATTAMFSIMSGVLLRPLPVKDADRILRLSEVNSRSGAELLVSMTDFLDWKSRLHAFSAMALYRVSQGNLTGLGAPERVRILQCDTTMLPLLGVAPVMGRNFSPEQTEPHRANEVLLTWAYWHSRFGAQNVLGRQVIIDEKPYTIVGVLPNLFMMFGEDNVWLPLEFDLSQRQNGRGYHWYHALARLNPGVSVQQANTEMTNIAAAIAQENPLRNEAVSAHAKPLRESITGDYGLALQLLFWFVVVVLCIACANVASLSLARASSRQREMSIRIALGATRTQLFRQMLTESVLLSCAAGIAGVVLAYVLVRIATHLSFLKIPLSQNIQTDWRVLLFSAGVAVLTGIGFGLAPAIRASLVQVGDALRQSSTRSTDSPAQRNLKRSFVVIQAALAASLLVFSGLLLRSFVRASHIELGFNPHDVLTLHVSLPPSRIDFEHPGKISLFARTVLDRIRSIPGIQDAAITSNVPLIGTGGGAGVLVEGKPQPISPFSAPYAEWTLISPGYFRTLNIPILHGRDFEIRDDRKSPSVAIVNQAFVNHLMDGDARFSKRIALASDPSRYRQIVGVVGNVHQLGVEKETIPEVFLPIYQVEDIWLAIVARTNGNPMQYVATVRKAVQSVDPEIAVFLPRTMEQIVTEQRGWRKFETFLVSSFAAVAILLAAVGSYAVVSYAVTQRFSEIGIRKALGATDTNILKSFTLQGSIPAILGTCLGILLGFWAGRLSARLLYGIGPYDALSYCAAAAVIIFVAVAASYLPARRAASLDPSRALRYE